jgi:hypothetical protein
LLSNCLKFKQAFYTLHVKNNELAGEISSLLRKNNQVLYFYNPQLLFFGGSKKVAFFELFFEKCVVDATGVVLGVVVFCKEHVGSGIGFKGIYHNTTTYHNLPFVVFLTNYMRFHHNTTTTL